MSPVRRHLQIWELSVKSSTKHNAKKLKVVGLFLIWRKLKANNNRKVNEFQRMTYKTLYHDHCSSPACQSKKFFRERFKQILKRYSYFAPTLSSSDELEVSITVCVPGICVLASNKTKSSLVSISFYILARYKIEDILYGYIIYACYILMWKILVEKQFQ